ncbi:Ras- protein Rab-13 [Dinochytrium kinnereticum]|nr:Ras- protein Rab-13 [Dinochytrium kinnereticum]
MQKDQGAVSRRISVNTQSGVYASEARDIIVDNSGNNFTGGVKLSVGTRVDGNIGSSPYASMNHEKSSKEQLSGSKDVMAYMEDQFGQQEQDERLKRKKHLDSEHDYDFNFKISIVGGKSVGKKTLVGKECEKENNNPRTQRSGQKSQFMGIAFQRKNYSVEGKKVLLEFWTAPASETYMGLSSRMLSRTAASIFIFNPYDKISYDVIQRWISLFHKDNNQPFEKESESTTKPPRILLANLIEKERTDRKVSEQDARSYAIRNGLLYHECKLVFHVQVDEDLALTGVVGFLSFAKKKNFEYFFVSIVHKVLEPLLFQKNGDLPFAALEKHVRVQSSLPPPAKMRFFKNVEAQRPNRHLASQTVDWL